MDSIRRTVMLAALAAFIVLPLSGALAQSDEAFIKYRQKLMGSQGANMGAIGDILKQGLPYKENIARHAAALNATAKIIAAAFEKRITAGATDAEPKIWDEWSEFQDKARDLERESARLMEVAASGSMSGLVDQVKAVGKTCGGCHKPYRKPKEESYRNR